MLMVVLAFGMTMVYAQSEQMEKTSHYKAVEELMVAMRMKETVNESVSQMVDLQTKNNPFLGGKEEALKSFMNKHMSFEVLKEDYIKIYMSEFTEAELKDMTTFYKTPTGKKVAATLNSIMMKASQLGQDRMAANMEELQKLMQ